MAKWRTHLLARGLAPRRGWTVHCAGTCRIHMKVERQESVRVTLGLSALKPGYGPVVCPAHGFARRRRGDGVRRLYWEKQGDGEYRIVGMAWAD
ncbi:MAG: hypothetical protein ACLSHC_12700 [Bilophila wadsworthia]